MQIKAFEIRDAGTFIPALAIDMNPSDDDDDQVHYLMQRCGYPCDGQPNVILTRLDGNGMATNDPYAWGDRTWATAHHYIIDNWARLSSGDVVCVETILGERGTPKQPERLTVR